MTLEYGIHQGSKLQEKVKSLNDLDSVQGELIMEYEKEG